MNTTLSPTIGINKCNNKSHIIFINSEQCKCDFEILSDFQFKCVEGSFFLSEGLTAPVLQVRAKKYKTN